MISDSEKIEHCEESIREMLAEIDRLRSLNAELLAACEAAKQAHEIVWLSTPTRILIDQAIAKAKEPKP